MPRLGEIVEKVRSKNAGPFWLTIDIFCGTETAFSHVCAVSDATVAELFHTDPATLKRFEIPQLRVLKFSLPRPQVQGHRLDRDMHGAGWAVLLSELDLPTQNGATDD